MCRRSLIGETAVVRVREGERERGRGRVYEVVGMCRLKDCEESNRRRKWGIMGLKTAAFGGDRLEKLRNSGVVSRSRMKLWIIRATTSILLWTCLVQLTALSETRGLRVLKGWPSCFSQESAAVALDLQSSPQHLVRVLPPKSECFCILSVFFDYLEMENFLNLEFFLMV